MEGEKVTSFPRIVCTTAFAGSFMFFMQATGIIIPALVMASGFKANASLTGYLSSGCGLIQLVGLVTAHISDGCHSKLGRRRPFLILGFILASCGNVLFSSIMFIPDTKIEETTRFISCIAALYVTAGSGSVGMQATQALIPDTIAKKKAGLGSGTMSFWSGFGGIIVLLLLTINTPFKYLGFIGAGMGVVLGTVAVCAAKETPLPKNKGKVAIKDDDDGNIQDGSGGKDRSKMMKKDQGCTCGRMWLSDIAHVKNYTQFASMVSAMGMAVNTLCSPFVGLLSDKTQRPKLFVLTGCAVTIATFVVWCFVETKWALIPMLLLLNLFASAKMCCTMHMCLSVLPSIRHAGKFLSYYTSMFMISQILAPLLLGLVLETAGSHHSVSEYFDPILLSESSLSLSSSFSSSSSPSRIPYTLTGYRWLFSVTIGVEIISATVISFINIERGKRAQFDEDNTDETSPLIH